MAIVVESVSSFNWANNVAFSLTKPTGLAVGDLMLVWWVTEINQGMVTSSMPSGFTELGRYPNAGGTFYPIAWVYYKIATSGDVAASNFDWQWDDGGIRYKSGGMMRISGVNQTTPIGASNSDVTQNNTSTPSFGNTVTPAAANSLIVLLFGSQDNANNIGGYAIVTSDPGGWTEVWDLKAVGTSSHNIQQSVAYALRTQTTATGNSSNTGGSTTSKWVGVQVSVSPAVAAGPTNLKSYNTNLKANIKSIDTNLIANVKSLNTNT